MLEQLGGGLPGDHGTLGKGRYTDVWQLRQGRWLCVSANVSRD